MKRKDFLRLAASIGISLGFTTTVFLTTSTKVPRRRRRSKSSSQSKIHKCEQGVTKLLKAKDYLGAIEFLESKNFGLIEPKSYYTEKLAHVSNNKGFKLLNLLAGLKLRYQTQPEFSQFLSKMKKYTEQNKDFKVILFVHWSSLPFKNKWLKENSKTKNNLRTWAGNVV
ncbi:hypothetical protein Q4Q39_17615 [Flavivirga amylovorans]|uniref:GH26 domain-containing protein n=1 Tax=Flavivirga amylovorans TaxID=870486 RepID=A0ABT8X5Q6_9FLAO|nr:hypothetical protein [Flavivirga amylovorans]MDO5989226.1 hypothetical protein [Flavivirga amylovorans]